MSPITESAGAAAANSAPEVKEIKDMKNVNNWHWIEKDCTAWAREYLESQVKSVSFSNTDASASLTALSEFKGDVNVSNRKGKVIYYYDLELKFNFKGNVGDVDISGSINLPEVMHDTDEFQFELTIDSENKEKSAIRNQLKQHLYPLLSKAVQSLGPALYDHQGKTVQYPSSKESSPAPSAGSSSSSSSGTSTNSAAGKTAGSHVSVATVPAKSVSTSNINLKSEFVTSAHELFEVFLDINRVKAWCGGDANVDRKVGGTFTLFGGMVQGVITGLEADRKIMQKWRLRTWPADHHSLVTLEFSQGSDSTTLHVSQTGVPVHDVDATEGNWNNFYFNRIKQVFGFGGFM